LKLKIRRERKRGNKREVIEDREAIRIKTE
jgi:hypothetical protein